MTSEVAPQFQARIGFARRDITPPVGIYHRMWGAALHDRSTGVHKPLLATAAWIEPLEGVGPAAVSVGPATVIVGLDHCILDRDEITALQSSAEHRTGLPGQQVHVSLSHTHGSGWMSRSRSHLPGGELLGPYLDRLAEQGGELVAAARAAARPARMVFGSGRCSLARHRDFFDTERGRYVCGFNPGGTADDTLIVGRATAEKTGSLLGTVVNYACHPTTLAWENTLISPDYVGAMREVVESATGGPCLFLQGASGDLGPRHGFVGDVAVADRNGRELGFAALAALESLPPAAVRFQYDGPVTSGAELGVWKYQPDERTSHTTSRTRKMIVPLPYRLDLPRMEETIAALERWKIEEAAALKRGDVVALQQARAMAEQMTRQHARLSRLPTGEAYPYPVTIHRTGHVAWVLVPGEPYQSFQTKLRDEFPTAAIVVAAITDDWQPGYIPAGTAYGKGIYQDVISAVAPGSLETLTTAVGKELRSLLVD
jgi:hypothetical protein